MSQSNRLMTGEGFDALPDSEKERVWQEIDRMTSEEFLAKSQPLTRKERAQWERARRKMVQSKPNRKRKRE